MVRSSHACYPLLDIELGLESLLVCYFPPISAVREQTALQDMLEEAHKQAEQLHETLESKRREREAAERAMME